MIVYSNKLTNRHLELLKMFKFYLDGSQLTEL